MPANVLASVGVLKVCSVELWWFERCRAERPDAEPLEAGSGAFVRPVTSDERRCADLRVRTCVVTRNYPVGPSPR